MCENYIVILRVTTSQPKHVTQFFNW